MTATFFDPEAKAAAARAVAAVERQTSAEIVLNVRRSSGYYRHADYLAGILAAFVALLLLLFLPQEFTVDSIAVDVGASFGIAATLSALVPPLRRAFVARALMAHNVRVSARAAFVDGGISRTRGRTGILVYISLFEKRVEVVGDLGIHPGELGPAYREAVKNLERSLERGADRDRVLAAVEALGPTLSEQLPHLDDDVNELSDEMEVAS